jgi:sugar phosphate isomerase/epimerase
MSQTSDLKISLAQWSLHKALEQGKFNHLDFPSKAKNDFGIEAVEYVSRFFNDQEENKAYLDDLNARCQDLGVKQLLIMIDGEGSLASPNSAERQTAIENHYKWVKAAEYLGCHSIRVNLHGEGTSEEVQQAAIDGFGRLGEFAEDYNINIIVENHGGYSSNPAWLVGVMEQVNRGNCGTLPDFGNFCIKGPSGSISSNECEEQYDIYKGVREMLPYAKALSAKSFDFDSQGNETLIDFAKMIQIAREGNYQGYIGIEYEGSRLSEEEGIKATKALLEKVIA